MPGYSRVLMVLRDMGVLEPESGDPDWDSRPKGPLAGGNDCDGLPAGRQQAKGARGSVSGGGQGTKALAH